MNEAAMSTSSNASTMRWASRVSEPPRRPWAGLPPVAISFSYGLPDPALFPSAALNEATEFVLREQSATALQYGSVRGTPQLVAAVRDKLRRDEGLDLPIEQYMITSGSSQANSLVLRASIEPGDTVLCEAPTFVGTLGQFHRVEAKTIGVPVDENGMNVDAAAQILSDLAAKGVQPKLIYTIPTFQNPMGVTMPLSRRLELLELAHKYDLLVLEDDAYRDLYFDAPPPHSLIALDGDGRVIRVGTFSKILAAGVRLGWAIGSPDAINRLIRIKDDGGTNPFAGHVAAAFMRAGQLEPLIANLRAAYKVKRDVALQALEQHMPASVKWTHPAGGFFIWLDLPASIDAVELLFHAREEGVEYLPGVDCFPNASGGQHGIRLAFSQLTPDNIEEGLKRLGRLIAQQLA